jgi:hypothetical protein
MYLQKYHTTKYMGDLAVPWLKRLEFGLSLCRPGFNLRPVLVGFMVDKLALGQVFH